MVAAPQCLSPWANRVVGASSPPQMPIFAHGEGEHRGFSPPPSGRCLYGDRGRFPSSTASSCTLRPANRRGDADIGYQRTTSHQRLQMLHTDPSSSASCSTDVNPALYLSNFANPLTQSLNPITPPGGPNPYATAPQHHFGMPGQNVAAANGSVPYGNASIGRNGYTSGAGTPRPGSGTGKRTGGRRPKEYEDYANQKNGGADG
uniref:AT-hook motif nuclear-localized protein n=1 Tax=Steinernema glaseri TaxID=37863 RepID=A0A1I7Z8Y8_9BILA